MIRDRPRLASLPFSTVHHQCVITDLSYDQTTVPPKAQGGGAVSVHPLWLVCIMLCPSFCINQGPRSLAGLPPNSASSISAALPAPPSVLTFISFVFHLTLIFPWGRFAASGKMKKSRKKKKKGSLLGGRKWKLPPQASCELRRGLANHSRQLRPATRADFPWATLAETWRYLAGGQRYLCRGQEVPLRRLMYLDSAGHYRSEPMKPPQSRQRR